MRTLALTLIRFYQRHLSPLKGFRCAYRAHTGHASCSQLGYRAIRRHRILKGLALLRQRLERCGDMHRAATRTGFAHYQRGHCDVVPLDACVDGADCLNVADCGGCDWGTGRLKHRDDKGVRLSRRLKEQVKDDKKEVKRSRSESAVPTPSQQGGRDEH